MRMSDIIKIGNKNTPNSSKKKFSYEPSWKAKEGNGIRMQKLHSSNAAYTDEHKTVEELYQRYVAEMRRIFNRAIISFDILPPKSHIQALAMEVSGSLQVSRVNVMDFFMRSETLDDNYLSSHTANVTFLSVMIGIWLNYNKSQLSQLAQACIFHDIGMINVLDIAQLPRKLTTAEREEIKKHPEYSKDFLEQIQGIDAVIIDAVYKHHGSQDASAAAVNEYSQIIGLADTFEAMTHFRAYKQAQEPHLAMRIIIEELKGKYHSKIIKALIDNIGIYPAGTFVRLDTEEIGLVIDVNPGSPLSPKVNIIFDKNIERLPEARTVDLSKQTNIHITNPLREEARQSLKERL
ncbi:MAG: HD domain-containing phosphohydrolase [Candidatus Omnitrophota bacterium]